MMSANPPHDPAPRNQYRGVVFVLLGASLLGALVALVGGVFLDNPVLLDTTVSFTLAAGMLVGVALAQRARARPPLSSGDEVKVSAAGEDRPEVDAGRLARVARFTARVRLWLRETGDMGTVRLATAFVGLLGSGLIVLRQDFAEAPSIPITGTGMAICLGAAGLAAAAVRYLADSDREAFPEAVDLCRGARVVAWIFALAAVSILLQWLDQPLVLRLLHFAILAINAVAIYELITMEPPAMAASDVFPLDLHVLSALGRRSNLLASLLDAGERQLGIDLRSTWALTVVRRAVEPLAIGLFGVAWLSTCFTVVGTSAQGLVERLGVPVAGDPLQPGLHVHWPWPVDKVAQIYVRRVQTVTVGHEIDEDDTGPENVLWAVVHAPNEYTLLLGNGRDLITVDAAVQFRIADARAWRYNCQNPAEALRAIAHRAVMRSTVNHTLTEVLSENVVVMTAGMRAMVQQDADALHLGVEVVGFTVGGMHPPVPVAPAYQAVVSAELGKVTAVVNAQALRNRIVPEAESAVVVNRNTALADGAKTLAVAAGEAWSFRALQSQYLSAPQEYVFRRRLETLEKTLPRRPFTVVDARVQRDGGELWVIP